MIKHKLPTFIFMAVLGLYAGNVHAANKYNEPCDEITASSDIAVTSTQYGKVAGYLETISLLLKVFLMPKQNASCRP